MTVAIVDDAFLIRQGLRKLIETNYPDITIVGEASNGAEGLELLKCKQVDVCIVDIRMPIMSGIEMVAQYRLTNQNTQFIVLSGYADFSYAKEMMGHGAVAYLLKPVNHQELHEVLQAIRNTRNQKGDLVSKVSEFLKEYTHPLTLILLTSNATDVRSKELEQHIHAVLEGIVFRCCVLNEKTVLLGISADIESEAVIFRITKSVWKKYEIHVCVVLASFDQGSSVSEEDLEALLESPFHCQEGEVLKYRKPKALEELPLFFLMEERLFLDLTLLNINGVARRLKSLVQQLSIYKISKNHCLFTINKIYLTLRRGLARRNIQPLLEILPRSKQLQALLAECDRFTQLEEVIEEIIEQLITFSATHQEKQTPQKAAISTVLRYIDENIHKRLSLNQVARVAGMNPSYFSLYFKKEMGETYISFLTRVKIQKAKELLQDPTLKIYELAQQLGYEDTKYFCRRFKNIVGLTPTQYKEAIIMRLDEQEKEGN